MEPCSRFSSASLDVCARLRSSTEKDAPHLFENLKEKRARDSKKISFIINISPHFTVAHYAKNAKDSSYYRRD